MEERERRRELQKNKREEDQYHEMWIKKINENRNQEELRGWKEEKLRELGRGVERRRELVGVRQGVMEGYLEMILYKENHLRSQITLINVLNPDRE